MNNKEKDKEDIKTFEIINQIASRIRTDFQDKGIMSYKHEEFKMLYAFCFKNLFFLPISKTRHSSKRDNFDDTLSDFSFSFPYLLQKFCEKTKFPSFVSFYIKWSRMTHLNLLSRRISLSWSVDTRNLLVLWKNEQEIQEIAVEKWLSKKWMLKRSNMVNYFSLNSAALITDRWEVKEYIDLIEHEQEETFNIKEFLFKLRKCPIVSPKMYDDIVSCMTKEKEEWKTWCRELWSIKRALSLFKINLVEYTNSDLDPKELTLKQVDELLDETLTTVPISYFKT